MMRAVTPHIYRAQTNLFCVTIDSPRFVFHPGKDETRAECLEAARKEAHERLALVLRREMEVNSPWG